MHISTVQIPTTQDETGFWLASLLVHEGQPVKEGQSLGRLEGKEPAFELFSPQEGYVVGLHARPGQVVPSGHVLCYICSEPSIAAARPGLWSDLVSDSSFDPSAILIFGGGGHGKTIIDLVRSLGTYRIIGVIDDSLPPGSEVIGVPVLGGASSLAEWRVRGIRMAVNAVGGIGNVAVRIKIFEILEKAGFVCPTLIHPSAVVERSARLEPGVQVCAQAYVGSDARVGYGSLINCAAIVHHDCAIGRVVNLSPGATLAGNVRVENHAQIGMLATVNMKITIGEDAMLGNGCTVKKDVPARTRVRAGTIWPIPEPEAAKPKEH
ncbi:MAG: NeuD/PglB/VioB family sugar acetyltransferase [Anaerolineaceae bacterium]|nr:NeuD/PglB/VioB family sugar acetyltransferase [Anaerolineaceae bacterium]